MTVITDPAIAEIMGVLRASSARASALEAKVLYAGPPLTAQLAPERLSCVFALGPFSQLVRG